MRKQRSEFEKEAKAAGYEIETKRIWKDSTDYILQKGMTRLAIELKRDEPIVETLVRLQMNYEYNLKLDKKVMERRRFLKEHEARIRENES